MNTCIANNVNAKVAAQGGRRASGSGYSRSLALSVILLLSAAQGLFAWGLGDLFYKRNFTYDVEKITGKLNKDETKLAQYAFMFYYAKFGYNALADIPFNRAVDNVTDAQYSEIVPKAAKFAKSPIAMKAYKAGAWGEKFLKALIVAADSAWSAGKEWAEKGAATYDANH